MRFEYNKSVSPPAPFVPVHVYHHLKNDINATLQAKIDSGADISAIPNRLVQTLQLNESSKFLVQSFDGQQSVILGYSTSMSLAGISLGRMNVITIPEDYVLIGRDALNNLRILLDGPANILEILETTAKFNP